jgi:acetyltransferase-like isoleucine patch superfamily enzyme
MDRGRELGVIILVGSTTLAAAFLLGLVFMPFATMQLISLIIVVATFALLIWVGYTMTTSPSPPETKGGSSTDVTPEDINMQSHPSLPRFSVVFEAKIGEGTIVRDHVNLFKCVIGKNCKIESYVYIEEGVKVGDNCKIKPHAYLPSGVTIEDDVFIGPNVTFTNDKHPRVSGDWQLQTTVVQRGASIGAGSVILPGVHIGRNAMIGAGSVVTKDIPDGATYSGNPAREMKT